MDVAALAELLRPQAESDSDDDIDSGRGPQLGPSSIGPTKRRDQENQRDSKKQDTGDIWDPDVVPDHRSLDDELDTRPSPEYEYLFQQAVGAEDVLLGMGNRNPSTASCENLLIRIKLPGVKYSDVQLDVTDSFLDCRTPLHKLGLSLPHPVDSKNGKAEWSEAKNLLTVTLRMTREYDFLQK